LALTIGSIKLFLCAETLVKTVYGLLLRYLHPGIMSKAVPT
jgi:hypothetical protein